MTTTQPGCQLSQVAPERHPTPPPLLTLEKNSSRSSDERNPQPHPRRPGCPLCGLRLRLDADGCFYCEHCSRIFENKEVSDEPRITQR